MADGSIREKVFCLDSDVAAREDKVDGSKVSVKRLAALASESRVGS